MTAAELLAVNELANGVRQRYENLSFMDMRLSGLSSLYEHVLFSI